MMAEHRTRCVYCNTPWEKHPGIMVTCKQLADAREEIKMLRRKLRESKAPKAATVSRKVESMEEARLISELLDMRGFGPQAPKMINGVRVDRTVTGGWRMWDAEREKWTSRKRVVKNAARWILKRSGKA
jgi:hypothetical protein